MVAGIFPAELVREKAVHRDNERWDIRIIAKLGSDTMYDGERIVDRLEQTRAFIKQIEAEQKKIMRRRLIVGGKTTP
jgi:hypothetical protein